MQLPTILVLLITTTVLSHQPAPPPAKSWHFPWNYTWIVLSERGDIVWSRSQTSPDVWWPNVLQPDLCKLALGAGAPWGVEDLFDQSAAPRALRGPLDSPGCSDPERRSVLRSYSFYVCPGQHRPRYQAEASQIIIVRHGGVRPQETLTGSPPPPGIISPSRPVIPTTVLFGQTM